MAAGGLNLTGNVSLNATPAIDALRETAARAEAVARNSRSATKTIKEMATSTNRLASAAEKERRSLSNLAIAQAKVNALQKESLEQQKLISARKAEVVSRTNETAETAELKRLIMAEESDVRTTNARTIAKERLNNEQLRGIEIAQRADNAQNVANGRTALTAAKAETEGVRQQIALRQQQEREDLNYTRRMKINSDMRIAQGRLEVAQRTAADRAAYQTESLALKRAAAENAARSRAQTELRESLSVTRGALSSVGSYMTHFGTIGAGIFIGLAAEAMHMDRQFANVVRTSTYLDASLKELNDLGFKGPNARQNAFDSLKLSFDALAQSLPVSYKQLTEIGAAANQLGVAAPNLAAFTKTVAQFSATTGVTVDTASTAFGRLDSLITDVYQNGKNLGGGVNHNFEALADSINKVGVRSVATDQQIINMASQIAGVSNAAGLGYKDIVGFSGALASVSISPYLARGLTTRLFTDIGNAVSDGGVELQKFAQVSGMSAKEFSAAWKNNPRTAITNFFDGIAASGGNAVNVLKSLGLKSVLDQPAIIRLARAADSLGNTANIATRKGGLMRQTFEDAYTAQGENARQYAKIAETVQSKLTVAFNRAQIALRTLGESNLDALGAVIDGLSTGMLRFSQNLDKPVTLLGQFKLPIKVGELASFLVALTGIVGVVGIIGGLGLKAAAGIIAVRQAFMGVSKFASMASQGFVGFITGADESAAAVRNLAAAETEYAAASARAHVQNRAANGIMPNRFGGANLANAMNEDIARSMGLVSKSAEESASAFSTSGSRMFSVWSGATGRMMVSNNRLISSLGNLSNKGTGGMVRLSNSITKIGGVARTAGSAVAGFLGGPLGIAIMSVAAIEGINALMSKMREAGTSASDMAVGLSQATKAEQILAGTKVDTNAPLITWFTGPKLKSFVTGTKEFKKASDNVGSGGMFNDLFAAMRTSGQDNNFYTFTNGLDKINAGVKQLADNGDIDSATASMQALFKGMTDKEIMNDLTHMPDVMSVLTTKVNSLGKTAGKDGKNILALIRNTLGLGDAGLKAANQQQALVEAFGNQTAAATEYMDAVKKAAAAAVDLNAAWDVAVKAKPKDPFGEFIKTAKQNFQDFVDFQKNALIIAHDTGASLAELSALDPGILAGAVKGGKKNEQALADVMQLKDAQAAYEAAVAKMANTPKVLDAFASLPSKIQDKITKGMSQGLGLPEAFALAGQKAVDAYNKVVPKNQRITFTPEVKLSDLAKQLDSLKHNSAAVLSFQVLADAAPAISEGESAKKIISNMRAVIVTDADTTTAIRSGESTADYLDRMKATITILGDKVPAIHAGEDARHYANRIRAKIIIDAKNELAKQKARDAKKAADHTKGTMKIDGDNKGAKDKARGAKTYANGLTGAIKIKADDSQFQRQMGIILDTGWTTFVSVITGHPMTPKKHKATGGSIYGPGTGTSDSIPAMLSNGEYVIRASQAQKYRSLLDQINYGINGYATGGMVARGSAAYEGTSAAIASSVSRTLALAQYTELSPYDRHLLTTIANNIGVVIAPQYIAQATTSTNRSQARRGNG